MDRHNVDSKQSVFYIIHLIQFEIMVGWVNICRDYIAKLEQQTHAPVVASVHGDTNKKFPACSTQQPIVVP